MDKKKIMTLVLIVLLSAFWIELFLKRNEIQIKIEQFTCTISSWSLDPIKTFTEKQVTQTTLLWILQKGKQTLLP
jgi:hypothetical protein